MSAAKHTPGPWEAKCRDVTYAGGQWPREQFLQWEVYGPDEPIGRGSFFQEDARLIAAAPELLAALKSLVVAAESIGGTHVEGWVQLDRMVEEATDVIAKATGDQS